jgi:hypothetical protein
MLLIVWPVLAYQCGHGLKLTFSPGGGGAGLLRRCVRFACCLRALGLVEGCVLFHQGLSRRLPSLAKREGVLSARSRARR